MKINVIVILFLALFIISCKKGEIERISPYEFRSPDHFPAVTYAFINNEVTQERFELGKKLFFDPLLSVDHSISCATCHAQVHAFADHNIALSIGVEERVGFRNSPSIANMAWNPSFMWDGGINHLEMVSIAPITDHNEMGEEMGSVIQKLNASNSYSELFKRAYGSSIITDQLLFRALTNYIVMIISDHSKYDYWVKGLVNFTSDELAGHTIFQAKCAHCHSGALQTDFSFRNNGLDSIFTDLGRGLITANPEENGKFKVPSLRNVMMTYPYMHDGRFFTIKQVLDHYSSGIVNSSTLDESLKNGIPLTDEEKNALITFLFTLNDYELIDNEYLNE